MADVQTDGASLVNAANIIFICKIGDNGRDFFSTVEVYYYLYEYLLMHIMLTEEIKMDIRMAGDVTIPVVIPRVDAHTAKEVESKLTELVTGGARKIVCDFSQTEYISSAGLRVFLQLLKNTQKAGGKIALCSLQPYVREVFDMAGFSQLFRIYDSEAEAVKGL